MRSVLSSRALPVVAVAFLAAACDLGPPRESKTVTRAIELDKAQSIDVQLEMGAGELVVNGGAAKLLDASFKFNVPEWEPVVDYQAGERGRLRVTQPSGGSTFRNVENTWTLRLNDGVPLDLNARLGAGQATMTLGTLDLRSVQLQQGAGELNLDLRGAPKRSYNVRVNGGVGAAHIRVPRAVAIVATATGGLGSVDIRGLTQRGDTWYNPAHENDPIAIRLDVKGGVGEIVISAE